jgi:sugar phosphate isomerase/epimerase
MKIGMVSDSLSNLSFTDMLDAAASVGVVGVEVNTGNWSSAPHIDMATMLKDAKARNTFMAAFADRGLELIALNCNGNQLHPTDGARQSAVVQDTVRLAGLLGIDTVCLMSGLPGGGPEEKTPNWIVCTWPPETGQIVQWQWEAKLIPYWQQLAALATANGVSRLAIELHGNQLVYNPPTLLRLRQATGPMVGANFDPSHMMWMGGDPLPSVDMLGEATFHIHAKDTYINQAKAATTTRLENDSTIDSADRAWNYITLGYGHGEGWWREFCYRLRVAGYDGWLSIEHEDPVLSRIEGVRRSVELLKAVAPDEASDYAAPAI